MGWGLTWRWTRVPLLLLVGLLASNKVAGLVVEWDVGAARIASAMTGREMILKSDFIVSGCFSLDGECGGKLWARWSVGWYSCVRRENPIHSFLARERM